MCFINCKGYKKVGRVQRNIGRMGFIDKGFKYLGEIIGVGYEGGSEIIFSYFFVVEK